MVTSIALCMCVCVCVCVSELERQRYSEGVCASVCVYVSMYVPGRLCLCEEISVSAR